MAFKCPHCSEGIDNVVTQETLEQRLAAKDNQIKTKADAERLLKDRIAELEPKARDAATIIAERDALKTQLAEVTESTARQRALLETGIDIKNERLVQGFNTLYASEMAGRSEGEEGWMSYADWLAAEEGAKAHPLLSHAFTTPPAATPPGTTPAPAPAPKPAAPPSRDPDGNAAAPPAPPKQGKMAPNELRAYYASPQFRSLTREQQDAKIAEIKQELEGPSSAA